MPDTTLENTEAAAPPQLQPAIEKLLRNTPQEFEFFQAVRLFERILPGRAPVGRFISPSKEVVRFAAHASLPFPASQIQRVEWPEKPGAAPLVVINFLGLSGPLGLLPLYYTELIVHRVREKDYALRDFLDMFHHRIISLFYQAWEKYRFTISYERGERDRFSHHLMDLIGLGTRWLENRLNVKDDSLLFYSGLLSMRVQSAAALERILWDYFDVPVEVQQFVGAWHRLDDNYLCRLGSNADASEDLGGGAIAGDEIWNQQCGVRIRLGPLSWRQYLDFLPSGTAYAPLRSLAKFASRGETDFEVQLVLAKEDVPACELGAGDEPPRLGWTAWAKTQPKRGDADDTILSI